MNCTHVPTGHTVVPEGAWSDGLLEAGFGDAELARSQGWRARVQRMLEVEAGLGRALARTGLIPSEAAAAIDRACDPRRLDLDALARSASTSATPVIPLIRALSDSGGDLVSAWLHHGATSQDIIDSAVALQLRDAFHRLEELLLTVGDRCVELADQHRGTLMAGRTLGQQATPITFGLKAARWLGAVDRRLEQLRWIEPRVVTVQLGGAAGSAAVYGDRAGSVVEALAEELGLLVPDLPWHAERDRIVEFAGALVGVATTVAAIAGDLILLAQTEVAEVRERAGTGAASSAMPHKHNPVHAVAARAASRLAVGDLTVVMQAAADHEHERAAGAWQAEWVAVPSAVVRTGGALLRLVAALEGLEFDGARAQENLDAGLGFTGSEALATALTAELGRQEAQRLVAQLTTTAVTSGRELRAVAAEDVRVGEVMDGEALGAVLDPANSVRQVDQLIERALANHAGLWASRRLS